MRAIDLAAFIQTTVLGRRMPPPAPPRMLAEAETDDEGVLTPSVVMKMDIEGSEFSVVSKLLSTGVLCSLDAAVVEWHDERYKGTAPIHASTGAPSNFSGLLAYVLASSAPGCGVSLAELAVDRT